MAHPLYVGSSVMGAGLAVAAGSLPVVALIVLYLAVTIAAAVRSEEATLRQRFGAEYDRYRRTPGGAAGGTVGGGGGGRAFSLRQALANREPRAIAGLGLAFLLLAFKATYNGTFWQPGG
jgi:hypothetical protein